MNRDDHLLDDIKRLDAEFTELTGHRAFGYIAHPTDTSQRITFHDGHVCLSMSEAHNHMLELNRLARTDPARLPWPLDTELTPEQDYRTTA